LWCTATAHLTDVANVTLKLNVALVLPMRLWVILTVGFGAATATGTLEAAADPAASVTVVEHANECPASLGFTV
jgi:hypothetical protein